MPHKFEYQTVQMPQSRLGAQMTTDFLNRAGADGWLLIQVIKTNEETLAMGDHHLAIFVKDAK